MKNGAMKTCYLLLTILFAITLQAQNSQPYVLALPKQGAAQSHIDTLSPKLKQLLRQYQQADKRNEEKIPNAYKAYQQPAFIYKGNNGSGFDIYESTLDGMSTIRPDKNNKSLMPTIGYLYNPKIELSKPTQLLPDSLLRLKKP